MKTLLTCIILFLPVISFCQNPMLTGSLEKQFQLHSGNKDSVLVTPHQSIVLLYNLETKKTYRTYSDSQGSFLFDNVPAGKYWLQIPDPKVKSKSIFVEVKDGGLNKIKPIMIDRVNDKLKFSY